jgi:hypothetical protein
MGIVTLISALLPIIGKLIDLFTKTPEEKIIDVKDSLLRYLSDVDAALKIVKETKGDTSELERVLSRRPR